MQHTSQTQPVDKSRVSNSGPSTLDPRPSTLAPSLFSRSAFTLIELLISMVIIAILIALLLPAVNSVMRRVRVAHVVTEIKDLEAALANFKSKFGMYPPSSITLYEYGAQWRTPVANAAEERRRVRSLAIIRRIWPQFDFSLDRDFYNPNPLTPGLQADPDGDNNAGVTLNGAACLVFFLGGVLDPDVFANTGVPLGFSKNPRDPFALGGSRDGPFFEFDTVRLNLARHANTPTAGSRFGVYRDPLPEQATPYVYASAYDGNGYDTSEATNFFTTNDFYRQITTSGGPGPYFKPNSFQIISPGFDLTYGSGGAISPGNSSGMGAADRDNITNFSTGMLVP